MHRPLVALAIHLFVAAMVGRLAVAGDLAPWALFETAIESKVAHTLAEFEALAADRRIEGLVGAGIVPAIVCGWGRPQHGGRSTLDQVGLAGFKRRWRHLVARYGSLPVVWIVGGETRDDYGP